MLSKLSDFPEMFLKRIKCLILWKKTHFSCIVTYDKFMSLTAGYFPKNSTEQRKITLFFLTLQ